MPAATWRALAEAEQLYYFHANFILRGRLDLWNSYLKYSALSHSQAQLRVNTGTRQHASIAQISDRGVELGLNRAMHMAYSDAHRYILAKDLSYDLMATIYDVNTRSILAMRMSRDLSAPVITKMVKALARMKSGNLEMRVIGLQNGRSAYSLSIEVMHKESGAKLMEADLFGNETRHIAIDTKTGVTYNLLMLNRIYRPGELVCSVKPEDFARSVSELVFE